MEFKDQIKHARETVHMSQQEFAAAIGVAHSSLNRWELGVRNLPMHSNGSFMTTAKTTESLLRRNNYEQATIGI